MSTQSISRPTPLYRPAEDRPALVIWPVLRRWFRRYASGWLAATVLLVIVLSVVFAEHLTSYHPTADMDLYNRSAPPFWLQGGSLDHPLGTDNLGRDIFSRVLHGGQVSLRVALIASTISTLAGMACGLLAGYMGGVLDRVLVGLMDVWISFPFLV
ncbi:MAG: ABC transporter permease, partial [Anaerolineales bacterium]